MRVRPVRKPSPSAPQIGWVATVDGNPALHFAPGLWSKIFALAEQQGAPSAQALVTRCVTDIINGNVKKQPQAPIRIKLEWATYGSDPRKSPEALLVLHEGTLPSISELWQLSEPDTRAMLAFLVSMSFERAFGASGTS